MAEKDEAKALRKEIKQERWTNQMLSLDLENTLDAMPLKEAIGEILEVNKTTDPLLGPSTGNPFAAMSPEEPDKE